MNSHRERTVFKRFLHVLTLAPFFAAPVFAQQGIGTGAIRQISTISAVKANFSAAQKKLDSRLVFGAMVSRNDGATASFSGLVTRPGLDATGSVAVDIKGNITAALINAVGAAGGTVISQFPRWNTMRVSLPLGALETVAARADVKSIQTATGAHTNAGSLTSQGYVSHSANLVVNNQGINGTGVTVGVLSDSASAARVAALIASGDLPAGTTVLAGEDGAPGSDEGAAMMEIVHDMAPGANLMFATAFTSEAGFASNIIALQAAGAKVIVDDVTYFDEGAFQDGPIAQAVNQVVASGAIYLSSAGNSGNKTLGTSGTWEGDFLNGGAVSGAIADAEETGDVHNFGTAGSPQNYNVITAASDFISLKWSDALGASSNDYDLFILDSTGTTVKGFSIGTQDGTQDPFEFIEQGTDCGTPSESGYCPAAGDRIVVVLFNGVARALRIDTNRGRLSINTTGSTYGHNAGLNTVSMAATYWNSAKTGTKPFTGAANPVEVFSSDGPRKIFYNPNGTAITPGNFLFGTNGGTTLQKPDLTAADGNSARTPGFNPFFGTSAAAPHAAGIAALVLQAKPAYTPAQVKAAMLAGTVDNMAPGTDRDSGYGIVMATSAVQYAVTH